MADAEDDIDFSALMRERQAVFALLQGEAQQLAEIGSSRPAISLRDALPEDFSEMSHSMSIEDLEISLMNVERACVARKREKSNRDNEHWSAIRKKYQLGVSERSATLRDATVH